MNELPTQFPLWYAVKFGTERHPRALFSTQPDAEHYALHNGGEVIPVDVTNFTLRRAEGMPL